MSRIAFDVSRTGQRTARINDVWIHSRFDPRREAERFVSETIPGNAETVIVIGPGLGYVFEALAGRQQRPRTIGISLTPTLASARVYEPDHTVDLAGGEDAGSELATLLSDGDLQGLSVAVWAPLASAFPDRANAAEQAIRTIVSRLQASLLTQAAQGRRWVRNTFHNFLNGEVHGFTKGRRPISAFVVTGAGPTLEESRRTIARHREKLVVCATSSSVEPLHYLGITPDLVMITDASAYAGLHLRLIARSSIPVIAPFAAARAIVHSGRFVPMTESSQVEQILLDGLPVPTVPPAGTVTASLLRAVRGMSPAPIYLAGTDLGWTGGRSHARPHANATFERSRSQRTSASRETAVLPADGFHQPRALREYATWMRDHAQRLFSPIRVLEPSPAWQPELEIGDSEISDAACDWVAPQAVPIDAWPDRGDRQRAARAALQQMRNAVGSPTSELQRELCVRLGSGTGRTEDGRLDSTPPDWTDALVREIDSIEESYL